MSDPTKIRLQVQDERVIVRLLMAHDMENGLRKDGAGKLVPAWFIQEVAVLWNGKPALTAQFGPSVSDRKSTRLNSSHSQQSRMPSSA